MTDEILRNYGIIRPKMDPITREDGRLSVDDYEVAFEYVEQIVMTSLGSGDDNLLSALEKEAKSFLDSLPQMDRKNIVRFISAKIA